MSGQRRSREVGLYDDSVDVYNDCRLAGTWPVETRFANTKNHEI